MALHPQVRAVLDARATPTASPPPAAKGNAQTALLEQMRREYEGSTAELSGLPPPVGAVEDLILDPRDARVPARLYRPNAERPVGVVVYLHGGGWCLGSPSTHDVVCRGLVCASGSVVLNVDYRLAPEHPFPAAVNDAEAALRWAHDHADELGTTGDRLAIAGDSAGANLATVIARRARDKGGPPVRLQVLIYPATDRSLNTRSYREFATGYGLTRDEMAACWSLYLAGDDGSSPDASPGRATDLSGLAPALVITAEYDPLRDEGESYGQRLRDAGVPTRVSRYEGMSHGFFRWLAKVDAAQDAIAEAGSALRESLGAATDRRAG